MSNKLKIFIRNFESSLGNMKAIYADNGTVWFLPKQILQTLGYTTFNDIKNIIEEDELIMLPFKGKNKQGETVVAKQYALSEAGLWRLVLESNTEESKQIKRWLVHDVMPNIRKHDGYVANMEVLSTDEKANFEAELSDLRYLIKQKEEELTHKNAQIEEMQCELDMTICAISDVEKIARIEEIINEARIQDGFGYINDLAAVYLNNRIRGLFTEEL